MATAGELKINGNLTSEIARETLKTCCDNIKRRIDEIMTRCMDLIDSEKHFTRHKKRYNGNRRNKTVRRKMVRGSLTYAHEIRQIKISYLKLTKERAEIKKESELSGKKTKTSMAEDILIEREGRTNLHNFTTLEPDEKLQKLFEKSGGYVPRNHHLHVSAQLGTLKSVKRQAEEAILACAVSADFHSF